MCIFKDNQFLWSGFSSFLCFEVITDCFSKNRMPHIFPLIKNPADCGSIPDIRIMVTVIPTHFAFLMPFQMAPKEFQDALFCENICYLCLTISSGLQADIFFLQLLLLLHRPANGLYLLDHAYTHKELHHCTSARFHSGLKNSFDFLACVSAYHSFMIFRNGVKSLSVGVALSILLLIAMKRTSFETVFLYNIRLFR